MNDLKSKLQSHVGAAATHADKKVILSAEIVSADEKNNTCSIRYVDINGKNRNKDNVAIRLYGSGTDYFPKNGDSVRVEEGPGTSVVIARNVSNYAMDVRSKMQLTNDIYSDDTGAIGGCIM